jgi:DNA polymerase-1
MKILIDFDPIIYAAAAASEDFIDVGDFSYRICDQKRVQYKIVSDTERLKQKLGATEVEYAMTSSTNFRNTMIWEDYKGHRDPKSRPCGLRAARAWARDYFDAQIIEGLEADDILGLRAHEFDVIVADDKDMETLPDATVYKPGKEIFVKTTQASADTFWLTQALQGDTADGYKGCPGVGAVKAARLLEPLEGDLGAQWAAVVEAFESADLTVDDAVIQAQLARILRAGELVDGVPVLWLPKGAGL